MVSTAQMKETKMKVGGWLSLKAKIDLLIDFDGISTFQYHTEGFGNHVHCTFISIFLCSFLRFFGFVWFDFGFMAYQPL